MVVTARRAWIAGGIAAVLIGVGIGVGKMGAPPMRAEPAGPSAPWSASRRYVLDAADGEHGTAIVVVRPPPDGEFDAMLEFQGGPDAPWHFLLSLRRGGYKLLELDQDHRAQIDLPLTCRRYRWSDPWSGVLTEPVELRAGGVVESVLDLTSVAVVRGHVEAPEGVEKRGLQILRLGPDPSAPQGPFSGEYEGTDEEGAFSVRVPGAYPVRLRPTGEGIVPAEVGGEVVVTGARDDVVLRVVRAP